MAGLGGMANSWEVEMFNFNSCMLSLYDLYAIVEKDSVCSRWDECKVLRPILNSHKHINLAYSKGVWRRV